MDEREGVKKQLLSHVLVSLPGENLNIMNALKKFKYDNRRRTSGDETLCLHLTEPRGITTNSHANVQH